MQIRLKKRNEDQISRVESMVKVDTIKFKKDLFEKELDNIEVCFRGLDASGIINLSVSEANSLFGELKKILKKK